MQDFADDGFAVSSNNPAAKGGKYGTADIVTKKKYRDFRLHVGFLVREEDGNSGVEKLFHLLEKPLNRCQTCWDDT